MSRDNYFYSGAMSLILHLYFMFPFKILYLNTVITLKLSYIIIIKIPKVKIYANIVYLDIKPLVGGPPQN